MPVLKIMVFLAMFLLIITACQGRTLTATNPPAGAFTPLPDLTDSQSATSTENTAPASTPTRTALAADQPESSPTEASLENDPTAEIPTQTANPAAVCQLTPADMLGPFYTPDAPLRSKVGDGYLLSGVVRSINGCQAIPNARVELWMAGVDGVYTDAYRATILTGADGVYRFESHFPPPYSNRPPHIHLRISASGYQPLVTQHYPQPGTTEAVFDVVLAPQN